MNFFDILSKIGIKRRKHAERGRNGPPEKFGKDGPDFFWRMVGGVQPESGLPRFSTHLVHELMYVFRVKRLACLHEILEFFNSHNHFPSFPYSSSVTGSSHSFDAFSPGTSKAR